MKSTEKSNYRVVVYPKDRLFLRFNLERAAEFQKEDCETIVAQIRRHVDDVGEIEIVCDTKEVCSFCGAEWTEEGESNGCCDDDVNAAHTKEE